MKKTILIADDSESIREMLQISFTEAGYQVISSKNGEEALVKLNEHNDDIDLVVTDLHMPKMDGISLIKEIRKNDKFNGLPILFLTTETLVAKKQEAKEAGATGWIVKPFAPVKLISTVQKVIR